MKKEISFRIKIPGFPDQKIASSEGGLPTPGYATELLPLFGLLPTNTKKDMIQDKKLGFLINFNVPLIKDGFKRKVNNYFIENSEPGLD